MLIKSWRAASVIFFFILFSLFFGVKGSLNEENVLGVRSHTVKKEERSSIVDTEYGGVSEVRISDGTKGPYYLQFITLEPNSLFLPVLLHADMVFYVHSGSGGLSWTEDDEIKRVDVRRGDVHRLHPGSVFFVQSALESEREKLRIYAIFSNTDDNLFEPAIGAYSSISDLVLGFDKKMLQSAFQVPEDVLEELFNAKKPPAMVHALPTEKTNFWKLEARFLKAFIGEGDGTLSSNKKKTKTYNFFDADPDFKNCNGWSTAVGKKDLHLLKDSNIGVFMVNLTKGSMMGPHWNPRATEIAIVLQGQGMIRVVCPSNGNETGCESKRFRVEEGDVFAVPRFHPMAQISFNNDSFVFMGFSTTVKRNHPQFIAGKSSLLQALNKDILAVSFNVSNTTIHQLVAAQAESVILDCTSCAEEEETIMEEEIRRKREEEERRKKEEEEERKRKEEKEARKEEEKQREEEEKRRRQEERQRREEEEERERREREEQEERKEEERRRREEEEERERERREREEQEEERRRGEEEAAAERERREREQEGERRQQEEESQRQEEEAQREEEEAMRQHEERKRREQEEEIRRREEEQRREQEEEERERRERREREEEPTPAEEEESERRRREKEAEEEEARRQWEERERRQREEESRRREEAAQSEEEEARRQHEERERRHGGGGEEEEMEGGDADTRLLNRMWELSHVALV